MTTLEEGYQIALDRIEKARITGSTKLDLSLLYLERLPIEILKLRNLSELTIIGHKFISFPEEITQLVNLTSLYLSGPMSAPRYKLPATIGRLVNLNSLHISFALTSLPVEIGQLINLKSLTLEFNSLTSLPKEISRLVALTSLDLSYNNFYSLPTEIGLLRNLTALKVNFNQITSIPSTIGQMKNLSVLDVHHNQLSSLPVEIGQLANLTSLDISHNQFSSFPVEIKKLVTLSTLNIEYNKLTSLSGEIGKLASLTSLNIRHNKISSVPREIGLLSNISTLNISYNRLISLPREISQLGNLVSLNARGNILTSLPAEIGQLINLKLLDIGNNELASLPIEIGQIINLKQLIIFGNQLKSLPSSLQDLGKLKHLNLKDNQLPIPPEILQKTRKHAVILDYYFSRQKKTLNECKMLVVGQGSVGKTSLVCRFIENKFNPEQNKTEGIEIYRYGVTAKESLYNINIWDFGGQEIMHATHQFFLTKRSLYLLVLDSRLTQEENRVEYWLKIIQSFSGESPVLIVGNKIDQHPLDIDRTGLQKKYPNIVDIFETSAATGVGMEKLRLAIAEEVYSLPHVRDELPESWFLVKKQLEEMGQDKNFIRYDEFLSLCLKNEVGDDDSQRSLIGFMHDLGVVLHFQDDPRLEALGILNPQWVTNGVYKILNSHTLFQNKGVLTTSMLDEILDLPEYPRGKRLFIVDMMKKFELCYDITPDKTFLVPDLLPKDQPAELKFNGVPAFEYAYPVLPTSVITRFIVRMNQKIDDGFVWRTGVVLKIGENKALVKADIEDRKITIAIDGLEYMRRDALSAIRYQLDEIHSSIKGLNPEKYIPIPNAISAKPLKYEYLLKLERAGKEFLDVEDGDELREVNISQILNGVESEYQRKQYGNVTKINIRGSVTGSTIIVGDNNQVIQDSYNKINSSEIAPELKETMKQLAEAVDTMIQKLPAEQAAEVAEDFSKLADEAVKPKPNQKWYSVSIEGLIKAAENLDKLGTPVISLSRKVLSLLTGGVVK